MIRRFLLRIGRVEPGEVRVVAWSAAYFFCLLGGYFLLRPVREQFGVRGGLDRVPFLFLATVAVSLLLNPVYGWVVSRVPRGRFVPIIYRFFALNLLVFFVLERALPDYDAKVGSVFYVWLSVFNLFAVSIFWQVMNDGLSPEQTKRLFGLIGVGGTLGAVCGSFVTTRLDVVSRVTGVAKDDLVPFLFLGGALGLEGALFCLRRLGPEFRRRLADPAAAEGRALGGGALQGIRAVVRSPYLLGICGWVFAASVLGTMLYFVQLQVVASVAPDEGTRTELFGWINFAEQSTALVLQLFFTGRIIRWLGVGKTLALLPLVTLCGLGALALVPTFAALVAVQMVHRGSNFGLANPARQSLFAVLSREEKYKAKAVIDTFVKRSGDASAAGFEILAQRAKLAAQTVFFVVGPIALGASVLGLWLGRERERKAAALVAPVSSPTDHD